MIYVVDNGGEYSAHELYFIELPDDLPRDDAIYLCEQIPEFSDDPEPSKRKVVLVAQAVEWCEEAPALVADFNTLLIALHKAKLTAADRKWFGLLPESVARAMLAAERAWAATLPVPCVDMQGRSVQDCVERTCREVEAWIDAGMPLRPEDES